MNSYWRKKITVLIKTIRAGLAMVIPVLFIGSITVLLNSLPLLRYQVFLDTFLGGALRYLFAQRTGRIFRHAGRYPGVLSVCEI